jgi:hypothetical protein
MFSVRSGFGAKAEALIVSMRSRAERSRVTGVGTPVTKSPDRPQYFVLTNDQSCPGMGRAEKFGIVDEAAAVRADGRVGRVSDNMTMMAAS